ncbi:MAG: tail fiber domain-containing protein [Candidatus Zixiibacteriota bacterium]
MPKFAACLGLCILSGILLAATPNQMNYQGRLTNSVGVPIDLQTPMTFSIFADSSGGLPIWTETQDSVLVRNGLFTVKLGKVNPVSDTVFKSDRRWMEIQVGADSPMSPRTLFVSVAYAFRSTYADSCNFTPTTDTVWQVSNGNVYRLTGNVGIGTTTPTTTLDVAGTGRFRWFAEVQDDGSRGPQLSLLNSLPGGRQYSVSSGEIPGNPGNFDIVDESAGGLSRLTIVPSGNVGLGTLTPERTLDVNGRARAISFGIGPSTPWADNGIYLDAGSQETFLWWDNRSNCGFYMSQGQGTNKMYHRSTGGGSTEEWKWVSAGLGDLFTIGPSIVSNRNVGIGTTAPDRKLTVVVPAGVNDVARFRSDNGNSDLIIGTAANQVSQIYTLSGQGLSIGTDGGLERVRISSSGNVGIGTTNPAYKLTVSGGAISLDADQPLRGADKWIASSNGTTTTFGSTELVDLQFDAGASNRMVIRAASGNVGIGTTAPDARLAISAGNEAAASVRNGSSTSVALWSYNSAGTAISCGTGTASAYAFQAISYNNQASSPAIACNGRLDATGPITASSNQNGVNAITGTSSGSYSGVAGISTGGGNGVYGSAPGPGYAGSFAGNLCYTGTFGACSDSHYKKNVLPIASSLDKIARLQGVTYEWRRDEFPSKNFPEGRHLGFIAQQMQQVVPEAVSQDPDGYLAVDYARLSAVLVEAVKELKTQNDELRSRLEKLEQRTAQFGHKPENTR